MTCEGWCGTVQAIPVRKRKLAIRAVAVALAVGLGVAQPSVASASCAYMSHNTWHTWSNASYNFEIMHGNFYVGYSKGYKTNNGGYPYRTRVYTCSGMNCPSALSPGTAQLNVVVQATGTFAIVQSDHMSFNTSGGSITFMTCRAAL